ncbi:hypothetical protein N4R57_16765 [Rhodobacteraceae bacterium D3-12]|nr:hypothetical protein N4R57_16765 [Rhodobacteraceae bacterium D3-12]
MIGIVILVGFAAAAIVAAVSFVLAVVVFGVAFAAVRTALPARATKRLIGLLCAMGVVFLVASYGYLSSRQPPRDVWETAFLFYLSGIYAVLSVAVSAVGLRIVLGLSKGRVLSPGQQAGIGGVGIVAGFAVAFVAMIGLTDVIERQSAAPAPITLAFGGGGTHCVNASLLRFHEGPSASYPAVLSLKRGEKLRLSRSPSASGWHRFETERDGETVIVYGLGGDHIVPVKFCRS